MKKRLIGIIAIMAIAATLCSMLVACGSAGTSVTHYDGKYAEIIGTYTPMSEVYSNGDNYLELRGDKDMVIALNGEEITGNYSIDGKNIKFTVKDSGAEYELEGTLENGIIEIDFMGMSTLVFAENGADLAKYSTAS